MPEQVVVGGCEVGELEAAGEVVEEGEGGGEGEGFGVGDQVPAGQGGGGRAWGMWGLVAVSWCRRIRQRWWRCCQALGFVETELAGFLE